MGESALFSRYKGPSPKGLAGELEETTSIPAPWEMPELLRTIAAQSGWSTKYVTLHFLGRGWAPLTYCPRYEGTAKRRIECPSCRCERGCKLLAELRGRRQGFAMRHLGPWEEHQISVSTDGSLRRGGCLVCFKYARDDEMVTVVVGYSPPLRRFTIQQVEAWAIYHALYFLPDGAKAVLGTDSTPSVEALSMRARRMAPPLRWWTESTLQLIRAKDLKITFQRVSRRRNGAGVHLDHLTDARAKFRGTLGNGSCRVLLAYEPAKLREFLAWMDLVKSMLADSAATIKEKRNTQAMWFPLTNNPNADVKLGASTCGNHSIAHSRKNIRNDY